MLVLSRKIREQVDIPELGIRFTVLSVGTNRVQLGIEAPQHIQITRPDAVHARRIPTTPGSILRELALKFEAVG